MSEKSKQAKSAERSKVATHGSKERSSRERERTMKKSKEDFKKMAEKLMKTHKAGTSPIIKGASQVSASDKPENPKAMKVTSKSMPEMSTSSKPEEPEAAKTPEIYTIISFEIPRVSQTPKTTATSVSTKLETSEVETPKVANISQMFMAMSKISSDQPEVCKVSETCQMSKTSEISASIKPEIPKIPEVPEVNRLSTSMFEISDKSEDYKFSEACQIPKTTPETSPSKFKFPEVPEESETSEILITFVEHKVPEIPEPFEIPNSKVPETCQMPKATSETSTSTELEAPKMPEVPEVNEMSIDMSKISISDESENCEVPETCQVPKATSETSTSTELEAPKMPEVPEVNEMSIDMSKISISDESENCEVPETCQVPKATSETSTSTELEAPKMPEVPEVNEMSIDMSKISVSDESENCEVPETCQVPKAISEMSTAEHEAPKMPEVAEISQVSMATIQTSDESEDFEILEACQVPETTSGISTSTFEVPEVPKESHLAKILSAFDKTVELEALERRQTRSMSKMSIETEEREIPDVQKPRPRSIASQIFKYDDLVEACQAHSSTSEMSTLTKSEDETNSTKDIKDDNVENPIKKFRKESSSEETKSFDNADKRMSVFEQNTKKSIREMMRRKIWKPISVPNFKEPHLVLATHHLVPSLPIELFEVFAEMIEVVTKRPVVLVHECRDNRPIAKEVVDIVVMPAAECWQDGVLLPASFVFEHHLNKSKSPGVYADVIVANDRASYIKDVMDLRGHKCAIPDKRSQFTAAGFLFNHLHSKGENLLFFGNIFDARTQLEVLEMVISKQAEVGVLESPVIGCHKYGVLDVDSLHILTSIGPMPPYRIMVKESLAKNLNEKLATYLLNINKYEEWLERLLPFGVVGFAKNSTDYYETSEVKEKHVVINVPYY